MVFTEHQMLLFFLILVRMTSMVLSAPVFSSRGIPRMIKIGLSGLISLLLFPIVNSYDPQFAMNHLTVILLVFGEIFTGVMIGFSMRLLFAGVELAGEYIGVDMGFALAQVYDPNFNQQLSVIARLKNILAILIFLIIDGHHFLIEAVAYSYKVLPIGSWKLSSMAIDKFIQMSAQIFVIGIKIGAPALVALFLTSVAMGIIARTVPQMNIFFVGFPLRIFVGLVFLIFGLSLFVYMFRNLLDGFQKDITFLLQAI